MDSRFRTKDPSGSLASGGRNGQAMGTTTNVWFIQDEMLYERARAGQAMWWDLRRGEVTISEGSMRFVDKKGEVVLDHLLRVVVERSGHIRIDYHDAAQVDSVWLGLGPTRNRVRDAVAEELRTACVEPEPEPAVAGSAASSAPPVDLEAYETDLQDRRAQQGRRDVAIGLLMLVIGISVTAVTYSNASGGGTYVVAWGAIGFGLIQFLKGLSAMSPRR